MAKILVARPCGYRMEFADTGTWLAQFSARLRDFSDISESHWFTVSNARILLNRNICATEALKHGCDYLLFVDPDMVPDYYVGKDPNAVPFFPAAWQFIKTHPYSIAAAPYCGPTPEERTHVFVRTSDGDAARLPRALAMKQRGWRAVEAVGTGLMLIDCRIFQKLPQPWFDDDYTDATKTCLLRSQGVHFCLSCRNLGFGVYVNFDCWALHYQPNLVHKPGWRQSDGVEHITPSPIAPDPSIPVLMLPTNAHPSAA